MPALKAAEYEAATAEFVHVSTIQLQLSSTKLRLGESKPGFAQGVRNVHTPKLSAVSYLPDKRHLYAGIDTGELRLWDFNAGARKQAWFLIGCHKGSISSVLAVSAAASMEAAAGLVLTGSADSSIKLWDVKLRVQETHVCVQTLVGHTGTVTSLVHKGACILSSSTDCSIRIWKAIEGRGMLSYPWFEPQVGCVHATCTLSLTVHRLCCVCDALTTALHVLTAGCLLFSVSSRIRLCHNILSMYGQALTPGLTCIQISPSFCRRACAMLCPGNRPIHFQLSISVFTVINLKTSAVMSNGITDPYLHPEAPTHAQFACA